MTNSLKYGTINYTVKKIKKKEGKEMIKRNTNLTLIFDMDGTLFDLYGKEDWLESIQNERLGLFEDLEAFDYVSKIIRPLKDLKAKGVQLGVCTWTPKGTSKNYCEVVKKEKVESLKKAGLFYLMDFVVCIPYGEDKADSVKKFRRSGSNIEILFDDNKEVRESFQYGQNRFAKPETEILSTIKILNRLI